eukprot:12809183-Alexandrium_andersonii.AAC.1
MVSERAEEAGDMAMDSLDENADQNKDGEDRHGEKRQEAGAQCIGYREWLEMERPKWRTMGGGGPHPCIRSLLYAAHCALDA